MIDFSQNGEQAVILEWAAGRRGSFLEVGAFDGISYSNTRALMLNGWPGIAIEPAPDMFELLCKNTDGYPLQRWRAAVVTEQPANGHVAMRWTPGQPFSTVNPRYGLEGGSEEIIVPAATVEWCVSQWATLVGEPRFLSLDTEGTTLSLLAAFLDQLDGFMHWGSLCVCVEAHHAVEGEQALARSLFELHGLEVIAANAINLIAAN